MMMKRHGCWRLVGWGAVALAIPTGVRAEDIRIWPTAVVDGDTVALKDVAYLTGFDAPTTEKLRELVVSASPREGAELLIQTGDVRGALSESGANLGSIRIFGASRCKVSRPRPPVTRPATQLATTKISPSPRSTARPTKAPSVPSREAVSGDTLRAALEDFLRAHVGQAEDSIEIRFSPACKRDLELDAASHRFSIRATGKETLGLVTLEVEITGGGVERRSIPIVAEVALVKSVVVAKRAINRGELIEGRHLRYEKRRFTDSSAIGLTDLTAAIGQQASRFVQAGEMLAPHSLESRPLVRRGDPVTVWVRQGELVIKTSGRAQQSGALGERIEVMRDGSRRRQDVFEAVVTGPATVTRGTESKVAMR